MTWRKQDCDFWSNGKIVIAVRRHGLAAGVLAQILLDINATKNRRGLLSAIESTPEYLASRICSLVNHTDTEVSTLLDGLVAVDFAEREEDGRLRILGWDQNEWGVRSPGGLGDLPERQCEECGTPFQPDRETHTSCSKQCRQAASRRKRRSGDAAATQERRSGDAATHDRPDRQTDQIERPEPESARDGRDLPALLDALASRSGGVPPDGLVGVLVGLEIATKDGEATDKTVEMARNFARGGGGRDDLLLLWRHCQKRGRNPRGMLIKLMERESSWRPAVESERAVSA